MRSRSRVLVIVGVAFVMVLLSATYLVVARPLSGPAAPPQSVPCPSGGSANGTCHRTLNATEPSGSVPFVVPQVLHPRPAIALSSPYTVNLQAVHNATASTATVSSVATWSLNAGKTIATLGYGSLSAPFLTWNGTVTLSLGCQLEFDAGTAAMGPVTKADVGTVWVNLTYVPYGSPTPVTYSWSTTAAAGYGTVIPPAHFIVKVAPSWTFPSNLNRSFSLSLAATSYAGYTFNGSAPTSLSSVAIPGSRGTNAFVSAALGTAGAVPFDWGWRWSFPSTVQTFGFAGAATTGYLKWSSPYRANATYSYLQSLSYGGEFTGNLISTAIDFVALPVAYAAGGAPVLVRSYTILLTVVSNVTAPFLAEYNYTIGGLTTSTTLSASSVFAYNATYSVYVYSATTPFGSVSKVTIAGNRSWTALSSWPAGATYYSGNDTYYWHTPIANETQAVFVAPNVYTPSTLTIVYVPTSPVFSLFGAALPYTAVLTYVNGVYQPYATFAVVVGSSYAIATYDVFNHLLTETNLTVTTSPTEVTQISLDIWPMTVANMNSSYVIGLLLTANSVTQTSPDIMPLGSETFYLPVGTYAFTLNYLVLNAPTIAKTVQFSLTITGVSYDVVTGLTFLNIQTTTVMTGNNVSRLVQSVNATLIDTNATVGQLVTSITNGLFAFHLNLGTGSRTKNVYDFPVYVTNGANGAVNGTITSAVESGLQATYINNTGSKAATFYATAPLAGTFQLFLTPTPQQNTEVDAGLGVFVLTSVIKVGGLTVVAAGVVGANALLTAVGFNLPVSPLNQQILLNVGNTTRDATTGYETSVATWTNPYNVTFGGQVVLTGPWLVDAQNLTLHLDGATLPAGSYSVTPTEIIVYAGAANVTKGGTLTVSTTYLEVAPLSLTGPFAQLGSLLVNLPLLYLLFALLTLLGVVVYERAMGTGYRYAYGLGMFFTIVGGVVFY